VRIHCVVLILLLAPGIVVGQGRLTGAWNGYWTRAGDTMPVTLHLQRDSAGRYTAMFDSDRLRVSGIPFSACNSRAAAT
jgi:hypothetical protein